MADPNGFAALCLSPGLAGFYLFGGSGAVLVTLLFSLPAEVSMASGKTPTPELLKAEEQHTEVGATATNHTPKTGLGGQKG